MSASVGVQGHESLLLDFASSQQMNGKEQTGGSSLSTLVTVGLLSWGAISAGFFGLKMLMNERPEFVGQPLRVTKAELIQESPRVVARKVSDDVSVIKAIQPEFSDVRFDMTGRRDYRGLRMIQDMSGQCRARYVLTNIFDEALFVLFKCPHPRTEHGAEQNLRAAELRLQSSIVGVQENSTNAWVWSGRLEPHQATAIDVSYRAASLKGVTYRVLPQDVNQVNQLRVAFHRNDIPSMRFESGEGAKPDSGEAVVWERKDFLAPDSFSAEIEETRSLHLSLLRLLDIGPLITLLFLSSVSAVLIARQRVTAIQLLTIAAGYAFYFPLILYLSANFSFHWALIIAVVVPGVLLVNYARWLLGPLLGLVGGIAFLGLYQVFPTLAALAGWNRGMLLLCLGIVTLAVLINLQNRALKRASVIVLALVALNASAAEVQVILPAELASKVVEQKRETISTQVAFEPVHYEVRHESTHLHVEARLGVEVLRTGEGPTPLFGVPVYLHESSVEPKDSEVARIVTVTNRLAVLAQATGRGKLRLVYRVPVQDREGKKRAEIPLVLSAPGNAHFESAHSSVEFLNGMLWAKSTADKVTAYEIGMAGAETLILEWPEQQGADGTLVPGKPASAMDFYGIGLTRAQNLTIINSDSSCTHFAEFELPAVQSDEFRLKLPAKARLISASVNGTEIGSPAVDNQLCRIRLPGRDAQRTTHRVSLRIGYAPVPLAFIGNAELMLPEVFQAAGTLEWVIALPNGFETQVISSGLEAQKGPPDLTRFGDYGRILKSHLHIYLAKDLAPPGAVNLVLKYRQVVSGM